MATETTQGAAVALSEDELLQRAHEIMRRPYRKVIQGDVEDGFLAMVPEFPGCRTAGETEEEALANLREAMEVWLMTVIEHGEPIPDPQPIPTLGEDLDRTGGRMLIRMPKTLHRRVLERAAEEGVSANQLAVATLARGLA